MGQPIYRCRSTYRREQGKRRRGSGERGWCLCELAKRHPEEDFSWMVDLVPRAEEDSKEEPEKERENYGTENIPGEQVRGDPPAK